MKESGKHFKMWDRALAALLCIVMVFGMLPAVAIGAEDTGVVTTLSNGGTIDGSTVTYANVTLDWHAADPSVGRGSDGWWLGIQVTAPADMTTEADFVNENGEVTYQRNEGGTWSAAKSFWNAQDSDKTAESTARYLTMWGLVNEEYLRNAIENGKDLNYQWQFDWNMDGTYEQLVTMVVDADTVKLMQDGAEVFPAANGYGTVSTLTAGGSVAGSTVTFSEAVLQFSEADTSVGRNSDGWWLGIQVNAPEGMTTAADFEDGENYVAYQTQTGANTWSEAKNFWNAQDSDKNAESTTRYLTMWGLVNETILDSFKEQGRNANYRWRFDWDMDGYYEQVVTLTLDPNGVTLMKGDVQIYPEISATVNVTTTGNGTVTVHGRTPADGQVTAPKGWEVEVVVTPGDDHTTVENLVINGQTVAVEKGAAYTGTYVFQGGESITADFVTRYTVTFENNGNGTFKDADGNVVTSITAKAGTDVQFRYEPKKGYTATVTTGDTALTANEEGLYTIPAIDADHAISASAKDVTPPEIVSITVSDPDVWTQEKEISVVAKDSTDDIPAVYIAAKKYDTLEELLAAGIAASASKTINANATYYIYAVDDSGNMTMATKPVENIDTTAPEIIKITSKENTFGGVEYTILVKETQSGIHSFNVSSYGWDIGVEGPEETDQKGVYEYTFTLWFNGEFNIVVTDVVGNTKTATKENWNADDDGPVIQVTTELDVWKTDEYVVEFTVQDGDENSNSSKVKSVYVSTSDDYTETEKLVLVEDADNDGIYTYTFTANATYYIHAIDGNDNWSEAKLVKIDHIDTATPRVPDVTADPAVWTNGNVTVSGTFTDTQETGVETGSEVQKIYYSTVVSDYDNDSAENTAELNHRNGTFEFVIPNNAEFNGAYYVWAVDEVGRKSDIREVTVMIDTTAPEVNSVVYSESVLNATQASDIYDLVYKTGLTVTITASDPVSEIGNSGVAEETYEYQLVALGEEPDDRAWRSSNSNVISIAHESFVGKVYVRVKDVAGTYSDPYTDDTIIVIDNVKPSAPKLTAWEGSEDLEYDNGWTKENVIIQADLQDNDTEVVSGVARYEYYVYTAKDKADGVILDLNNASWTAMPETEQDQAQKSDAVAMIFDQYTVSKDMNATVYVRAVSNTGIVSDATPVVIKVQKTLPNNAIVVMEGDLDSNGWYMENEDATIVLTQPVVDPYAAPVTIHYILTNTNPQGEPAEGTMTADNMAPMSLNGETGNYEFIIDPDGVYTLEIWTTDEAGNKCAEDNVVAYTETGRGTINVDATKPTDLDIQVTYTDAEGVEQTESVNNPAPVADENGNVSESFGFNKFYNSDITISLNADTNISGTAKFEYQIVDNRGSFDEANGNWKTYDGPFTVPTGSRFVIYFRATDVAGNSTIIYSTGIVVDNKEPSGDDSDATPEILITPEDPGADGFYNADTFVDVQVFDPLYTSDTTASANCSGLAKITYRIFAADIGAEETGVLFDVASGTWTNVEFNDDDLAVSWSGRIPVDAETFNSNNVYVEITAVDNSGNTRTTVLASPMMIDVTDPTIAIRYDNNVNDGVYYNKTRTATVVITERNLSYEDVLIAITNTDKVQPKISDWSVTGKLDDTKHTITITYAADGDYTFDISCVDMAGNPSVEEVYAEGTTNPTAFTVDQTAPEITVQYDNNAVASDKYFAATRTATITIVEHNFDKDRVTITMTADRGGVVPGYTWTSRGDVHTAVLEFAVDGDYTFDITMTDLAGNANNGVNYGSSKAPNDFVIDTDKDMIVIEGVENGKAYGYDATLAPSVTIEDINLSGWSVDLVGQMMGTYTDLYPQAMGCMNDGGDLVTGILDLFQVAQENDGIYTLTVTANDLAGNVHEEKIVFTVNRFGSVYDFGDGLKDLLKDVYTEEVTEALEITEYNADKLVPGSVVIEITRDGKPLDEVIYTVSPTINNEVTPGQMGWYEYVYSIDPANFAQDGLYKIYISSKDASGNQPENGNYDDKVITFWVDSTRPEVTSVVGLEKASYNKQTHEVNFTVFDAVGLKTVTVTVNIDGVKEEIVFDAEDFGDDINSFNGSFTLEENDSAQLITIHVVDMAGNEFSTDWYGTELDSGEKIDEPVFTFNNRVVISTNFFVLWFSNQPLFWGSIIAIIALAAFAWWFLIGKRKKDEEEEEEQKAAK